MNAILPVLIALNVLFASVATPVFIAGMGLGAGAGGSGLKQPADLIKNAIDRRNAYIIFINSCDKDKWEPKETYPTSQGDPYFQNLVKDPESIRGKCKALNDGKFGIIHIGGNEEEMISLFQEHWDRRVLATVYALFNKRVSSASDKSVTSSNSDNALLEKAEAALPTQEEKVGYGADCKDGDKSAPSLVIRTTAGFMDYFGRPTALAKSGIEDDPEATDVSNSAVNPQGYGKGTDIYSVGCTKIMKDGKVEQIIPNYLSTGQEERAADAAPGMDLVSGANFEDNELMDPALAEIYAGNDSLYMAGIDEAERQELGALQVAAGIVDPDALPEIIPHLDPPDDLQNDLAATIPDAKKPSKPTFIERVAQFGERIIEQKYFPVSGFSGIFSGGTDPVEMGRNILYSQAGIYLSKKPTSEEIAKAAAELGGFQNPEASVQIPPSAVKALQAGKVDEALKLISTSRISKQFSQNLTANQIAQKAASGYSASDLKQILKGEFPIEDPREQQMIDALLDGGYKGLAQTLEGMQNEIVKTATGSLKNILMNSNELTKNQKTALSDFANKDFRDGVENQLKRSSAPKELVEWAKQNKILQGEDLEQAVSVIKDYSSSANGKEKIANREGEIYTTIVKSAATLMKPDEQAIFYSFFGTNPSAESLKKSFEDGTLEQAGLATVYSKGLQRLGIRPSESTYLAVELAKGQMSGSDAGVKLFNARFGSYGVQFSKSDFEAMKNGNFAAAQTLGTAMVAKRTGIDIGAVQKAIGGDKAAGLQVSGALTKRLNLPPIAQKAVDGLVGKLTGDLKTFSQNTAKVGAKAKASAISAGISEGNSIKEVTENRVTNAGKLEKAFNNSIDGQVSSSQASAKDLLVQKGVDPQSAENVIAGNVINAEQTTSTSFVANKLSKEGKGDKKSIEKILLGKETKEKVKAFGENLTRGFLAENNIYVANDISITDTLFKGSNEQKTALIKDIGGQYATNQMLEKVNEIAGISVSLSAEQRQQFARGDFGELSKVGEQTVRAEAANRLSNITGGVIPSETITRAYDSLKEDGVLAEGEIENIGWDVAQENLGFSKDTIKNFDQNLKNLPQNLLKGFDVKIMEAQLTAIGAGIIVNTLIGNQLAKIDPTGGILTAFAMHYATQFVLSLGLSMPILLGIAFILNPAATIQAIKGMIIMAFAIFSDPIGTIMGLFGFGKKKPKMESAVTNPENKNKDKIKDPSGFVDTPLEQNPSQMAAMAADKESVKVQATSDYLPAKKPSKEFLQKISRRTVDQTIEDLLLMRLASSGNSAIVKADPDFISNHFSRYLGVKPDVVSLAFRQLISPRAPVPKDKQNQAKEKGIKDFLYEKEYPSGAKGLRYAIDLSRLIFGNSSSPLQNGKRVSGFSISSSIYQHIHVSF